MKRLLFFVLLAFLSTKTVFAQLEKPVSWLYKAEKINSTTAILHIKASLKEKWHIYSLNVKGIPAKTSIKFTPSKDFSLIGKTNEPKPVSKYDKILKTNLTYFENEVTFTQKIKLNKSSTKVKGTIEFMACNDKQCLPTEEVSFRIAVK